MLTSRFLVLSRCTPIMDSIVILWVWKMGFWWELEVPEVHFQRETVGEVGFLNYSNPFLCSCMRFCDERTHLGVSSFQHCDFSDENLAEISGVSDHLEKWVLEVRCRQWSCGILLWGHFVVMKCLQGTSARRGSYFSCNFLSFSSSSAVTVHKLSMLERIPNWVLVKM